MATKRHYQYYSFFTHLVKCLLSCTASYIRHTEGAFLRCPSLHHYLHLEPTKPLQKPVFKSRYLCSTPLLHIKTQIIAVNIQEIKIAQKVDIIIAFISGACFRSNRIEDPPATKSPTGKPMSIPKVELSYAPQKVISISILKMPPPIAPIMAQALIKASVFALFRFWTPFSDMVFSRLTRFAD